MRRSIATVSLSGTLDEKLRAIAAAGFDAIELFENDLINFSGTPRQVRQLALDLGLAIDLFQPFRDFEGVPDDLFRRNLDRAERKFDTMAELGAAMMLVCSNVGSQAIADDARAAAQLRALAERAAARGMRISYEALAWGGQVRSYAHAWRIVELAAHPNLGLTLDTFHTLAMGDDPAGIAALPGERIFFLQVADAPQLRMDALSWSRHFRCFPGQGEFDLAGFLITVLRTGYAGPLSLEVFNDVFRASDPRQTAIDGMRSLLFLEEQVRLRSEPDASPILGTGVDLFDPPPWPKADGIGFLEFAVDADAALALGGLLERLGFVLAGRHRSKAATLYRQGEISVILDARAIRAVDGSLVYFIDGGIESRSWFAVDFDLTASSGAAEQGAGLRTVDHLAIALPAEALDAWVLFYQAILGLEPHGQLELAEPYGLMRSRALADQTRGLRITLNVSEGRNTAMARSLSAFAGAGVHHIAFACADIFETVATLKSAGVAFLPIPDNYYDDLQARLDLPAPALAKLRASGVLYDASPAGEFFHIPTQSFAGRFSFELVQRVGKYDGHGEVNAPVYLAAQAQASRAS